MGGRGSSSGKAPFFQTLGRRGKEKDIGQSMIDANPHYYEGREWQQNCQRCIYAYEMQRRGYDVEAQPRDFSGNDRLPYMNDKEGWPKVMENSKLVGMDEIKGRTTTLKLLNKMAEWGDGARAVVRVVWKRGHSGHVFIAEQEKGGTVFLDPQTGRYIDVNSYLNESKKTETKLMRMDNLKPTALIEKCVRKREKKK